MNPVAKDYLVSLNKRGFPVVPEEFATTGKL